MFGKKHVTREDRRAPRRVSRGKDRRRFGQTADRIDRTNIQTPGRPMRGGIRL